MALQPIVSFSRVVPRDGSTIEECEDRLAVSASRFAVADGASDAIYSDVWADLLVSAFCSVATCEDGDAQDDGASWLAESRARWREWTSSLDVDALPWFTREKLRAGSFATFAGLTFDSAVDAGSAGSPATLIWTARACGDACVFLVRGGELALSFPATASDGFANSPRLLATSSGGAAALHVVCGRSEPGDRFYLATDALAQWLLAEHERGGRPWDAIDAVTRPDVFDALVHDARRTGALRNDDVSFVAIAAATVE